MINRSHVYAIFLVLWWSAHAAHAAHATTVVHYRSIAEEARVNAIAAELRCMQCQNQSVDESQSTLALVIKQQIARLLRQGLDDEQIRAYFVNRYGDLISYRPPFNRRTWILWCGPFALLILGALWLFTQMGWREQAGTDPSARGRGQC